MSADSYESVNGRSYRVSDGNRELMANFVATITLESRISDGRSVQTVLTIQGDQPAEEGNDPEKVRALPEVVVPSEDFASMSWVMTCWGTAGYMSPGQGIRDDLRASIQLRSTPKIEAVYRHTGWTKVGGKRAFVTSGGAITAAGMNQSVRVELPTELERYDLTPVAKLPVASAAVMRLLQMGPPEVMWPLLAGAFLPLFTDVDFAIHVSGRTGTFKSEVMALLQNLFGSEWNARHLPASWGSTGNALEAQCYLAKDVPIVVDDFVPNGTPYQRKQYQATADKLIRAAGNRSGRARLTDRSTLQGTMYPRGLILSTGEDVPEGHSVRARMLILELAPGDISSAALTACQAERELYASFTAHLVKYLAKEPVEIGQVAQKIRDEYIDIGHTRTPPMLGALSASAYALTEWMLEAGLLSSQKMLAMQKEAREAIREAGSHQRSYLEETDPCEVFMTTLRNALGTGTFHMRAMSGGIPEKAELLGWTKETSTGSMPTFRSHGPCVGWVDWTGDQMYLDAVGGVQAVMKAAGGEVSLTRQTMIKRLCDASMLTRTDPARRRNTVRVTAEQHTRQVCCFSLSETLECGEKP